MSARQSIYIDAPVEKAFDFCKNPRNWPSLAPPALAGRVEMIHLHATEEGLGTSYV